MQRDVFLVKHSCWWHEDRSAMDTCYYSAFHMAEQGAHDSLFQPELLLDVNGCQVRGSSLFAEINIFPYAPISNCLSMRRYRTLIKSGRFKRIKQAYKRTLQTEGTKEVKEGRRKTSWEGDTGCHQWWESKTGWVSALSLTNVYTILINIESQVALQLDI